MTNTQTPAEFATHHVVSRQGYGFTVVRNSTNDEFSQHGTRIVAVSGPYTTRGQAQAEAERRNAQAQS